MILYPLLLTENGLWLTWFDYGGRGTCLSFPRSFCQIIWRGGEGAGPLHSHAGGASACTRHRLPSGQAFMWSWRRWGSQAPGCDLHIRGAGTGCGIGGAPASSGSPSECSPLGSSHRTLTAQSRISNSKFEGLILPLEWPPGPRPPSPSMSCMGVGDVTTYNKESGR